MPCVYVCTGMTIGGVWGVGEGIQRGAGLSSRLRATGIVNGVTRRGPFMANNLAVLGELSFSVRVVECVGKTHNQTELPLEIQTNLFMWQKQSAKVENMNVYSQTLQ